MDKRKAIGARPEPEPSIVHWATHGKYAGRVMDYEILASSIEPAIAEAVVGRGLTGSAEGPAEGRPEALPWLSFTGSRAGQQPVMSIAAATWGLLADGQPLTDGHGRPVVPVRLLMVPWQSAAAHRLTFSGLEAVARRVPWPADPPPGQGPLRGKPLQVKLPGFDAAAVAKTIIDLGFEWVATMAALMLDGEQVVITAPPDRFPPLEHRLRTLDAICALLPFGFRARFTAATWASIRAQHSVQLTFGSGPRSGQREASYRMLNDTRPRNADSIAYYETLRRLYNRGDDAGEGIPNAISTMVAHLSAMTDPAACENASAMCDYLAILDLANEVDRKVTAGTATATDIKRVFDLGQTLSPEMREAWCIHLADRIAIDPGAHSVLCTMWMLWPDEITALLVEHGRPTLSSTTKSRIERWLAAAADVDQRRPGTSDSLFHGLLRLRRGTTDIDVARTAVALIRERKASKDTQVRMLVADQPLLGIQLLTEVLTGSGGQARAIRETVEPLLQQVSAEQSWLRAIALAAGLQASISPLGPRPVSAADLSQLSEHPSGWLLFVRIGVICKSLNDVVPLLWWMVKEEASLRGPGGYSAKPAVDDQLLRYLRPDACEWPAGKVRGQIDLLCLMHVGQMPWLASDNREPSPNYLQGLSETWFSLDGNWRHSLREPMLQSIVARAEGYARVVRLVGMVDAVDPTLRLSAISLIIDAIQQEPQRCLEYDFPDDWLREISRHPHAGGFLTLQQIHAHVRQQSSAEEVARAYHRAVAARASHDGLFAILVPWFERTDVHGIDRLLDQLEVLELVPHASDIARRLLRGGALSDSRTQVWRKWVAWQRNRYERYDPSSWKIWKRW